MQSFGKIAFYMTQVLTRHSCFASYLKRFHIQDAYSYAKCGFMSDGFFHCDAWENSRRQTCVEIGTDKIRPENLVDFLLSSLHSWSLISNLIKSIMQTRESEERNRQRQVIT